MSVKKSIATLCYGIIFSFLTIMLFSTNIKTANASSPTKFLALGSVNYIAELPNGEGYNEKTDYTADCFLSEYFAVYLSSQSSVDYTTAAKNTVFNFSNVTISAEIKKDTSPHDANYDFHHQSYLLKNMTTNRTIANGTLSGTSTISFLSKTLLDGQYALQYVASGTRKDGGSGKITDYFTFSFFIDATPPLCSLKADGADILNESYTNKMVTFTATDERFEKLYYRKPATEIFLEATSASYAVSATVANNGLWSFYATDSVGNRSETFSVYIDTIKPIGKIASGGNIISNGIYINQAFIYNATDTGGILEYQYKSPSDSVWKKYNGEQILAEAENGWYYFRAIDKAGQFSDESRVCLDSEIPTGTIYQSESDNSVYFSWEKDFWTATLDGKSYLKGTIITEEGDHKIILTSPTGANVEYVFSIEHYFLEIETVAPTCTNEGFTRYECKNCGETYGDAITEALGHDYEEREVHGNCTEDSLLVYQCKRCDYEYSTVTEKATGHTYESEVIKKASCTESGQRSHTCSRCHDSNIAVIPATGHDYAITDVKTENGKTQRTYTCKTCGHSYIQDLGNQYDKVSSYVEYLFNQYSPYMVWVLLATSAIWSIVMGVMLIIAQKNEDKAKAKKMISNYCLGLVVIFIILVACPYLINGIAALLK